MDVSAAPGIDSISANDLDDSVGFRVNDSNTSRKLTYDVRLFFIIIEDYVPRPEIRWQLNSSALPGDHIVSCHDIGTEL